jgi:hypothetical protein
MSTLIRQPGKLQPIKDFAWRERTLPFGKVDGIGNAKSHKESDHPRMVNPSQKADNTYAWAGRDERRLLMRQLALMHIVMASAMLQAKKCTCRGLKNSFLLGKVFERVT